MIGAAAATVTLVVLGDALVLMFGLPVPGAALGLFALSAWFAVRRGPGDGFGALFDFAAPYFALFFVPAAVGVLANLDELIRIWAEILCAVVLGTAATLAVAGRVAQRLMAPTRRGALA